MQRGSNPLKLYPFPHNQFNEGYKAMHSRICGSSGKVFVETLSDVKPDTLRAS